MINLIERFNKFVFALFSPDFYKKIPAKTIAIIVGLFFGIFLIAVAGLSIRKTLIKMQLTKTHNALVMYVKDIRKIDETVSDIESIENNMTASSSMHQFDDDIKEYDEEYKALQKSHAALEKESAKAPSKDTEKYYATIRDFDKKVYEEYTEGGKMLHSTHKMMKIADVVRKQNFDDVTFADVNSKEDLIGKFDEMKQKFEALHNTIPVIKGDEYFDVFYGPLNTTTEKLIADFDKIKTAIRNEDVAMLNQIERDYKKDIIDFDSIDTYKIEKAVKASKKRTDEINDIVPKLNEQDKAVLKSYDIMTEDQLPYFMKQKMFRNMDSFKDNKILDLPVNKL